MRETELGELNKKEWKVPTTGFDATCMFCGRPIANPGEGYYDHIRQYKGCEAAWRQWRENLLADHPGGD